MCERVCGGVRGWLGLQHRVRQRLGCVVLAAREAHRRHERCREDGGGAEARSGGQVRPRLDLEPAAALRELLGEWAALRVAQGDDAAEEQHAPGRGTWGWQAWRVGLAGLDAWG